MFGCCLSEGFGKCLKTAAWWDAFVIHKVYEEAVKLIIFANS